MCVCVLARCVQGVEEGLMHRSSNPVRARAREEKAHPHTHNMVQRVVYSKPTFDARMNPMGTTERIR